MWVLLSHIQENPMTELKLENSYLYILFHDWNFCYLHSFLIITRYLALSISFLPSILCPYAYLLTCVSYIYYRPVPYTEVRTLFSFLRLWFLDYTFIFPKIGCFIFLYKWSVFRFKCATSNTGFHNCYASLAYPKVSNWLQMNQWQWCLWLSEFGRSDLDLRLTPRFTHW